TLLGCVEIARTLHRRSSWLGWEHRRSGFVEWAVTLVALCHQFSGAAHGGATVGADPFLHLHGLLRRDDRFQLGDQRLEMDTIFAQDLSKAFSVTTGATPAVDNQSTGPSFGAELGIVVVRPRGLAVILLVQMEQFMTKGAEDQGGVAGELVDV